MIKSDKDLNGTQRDVSETLIKAVDLYLNECNGQKGKLNPILRYINTGDATGFHNLFLRLNEGSPAKAMYNRFFCSVDECTLRKNIENLRNIRGDYYGKKIGGAESAHPC